MKKQRKSLGWKISKKTKVKRQKQKGKKKV